VRALGGLDAWFSGVRRDQAPTRANAPKLGWDAAHELWKANPLADWSDADCWDYIKARDLPYNPLHDRGYASIGDTHSTIPGAGREERWAGTERRGAVVMTECEYNEYRPHTHSVAARRAGERGDPHHARGRRRA
jgi:3'-phosphoadenosine 5'-phosphosulfate sulfotransferase (PAPS reductase)/FAD synthetase